MSARTPPARRGLLRRFARGRSGIAALEFGFAAPILLLLLIGTFDVGRAIAMQATLRHAVHEGARYAAIHGAESLLPRSPDEVTAFVRDRLTWLDGTAVTVTVEYAPDANSGATVSILAERPFAFMIADLAGLGELDLAAHASMTVL